MDTYWVPGVNNSGRYGRWAFAEFTNIFTMPTDLDDEITKQKSVTNLRISFAALLKDTTDGTNHGE